MPLKIASMRVFWSVERSLALFAGKKEIEKKKIFPWAVKSFFSSLCNNNISVFCTENSNRRRMKAFRAIYRHFHPPQNFPRIIGKFNCILAEVRANSNYFSCLHMAGIIMHLHIFTFFRVRLATVWKKSRRMSLSEILSSLVWCLPMHEFSRRYVKAN